MTRSCPSFLDAPTALLLCCWFCVWETRRHYLALALSIFTMTMICVARFANLKKKVSLAKQKIGPRMRLQTDHISSVSGDLHSAVH